MEIQGNPLKTGMAIRIRLGLIRYFLDHNSESEILEKLASRGWRRRGQENSLKPIPRHL